jgi:hypothetical protein
MESRQRAKNDRIADWFNEQHCFWKQEATSARRPRVRRFARFMAKWAAGGEEDYREGLDSSRNEGRAYDYAADAVTRHVAYVEPRRVLPMPWARKRQREILDALAQEYPALPDTPASISGSAAAFAFPTSVTAAEARERLEGLLDGIDPGWRRVLKIFDGFDPP